MPRLARPIAEAFASCVAFSQSSKTQNYPCSVAGTNKIETDKYENQTTPAGSRWLFPNTLY